MWPNGSETVSYSFQREKLGKTKVGGIVSGLIGGLLC